MSESSPVCSDMRDTLGDGAEGGGGREHARGGEEANRWGSDTGEGLRRLDLDNDSPVHTRWPGPACIPHNEDTLIAVEHPHLKEAGFDPHNHGYRQEIPIYGDLGTQQNYKEADQMCCRNDYQQGGKQIYEGACVVSGGISESASVSSDMGGSLYGGGGTGGQREYDRRDGGANRSSFAGNQADQRLPAVLAEHPRLRKAGFHTDDYGYWEQINSDKYKVGHISDRTLMKYAFSKGKRRKKMNNGEMENGTNNVEEEESSVAGQKKDKVDNGGEEENYTREERSNGHQGKESGNIDGDEEGVDDSGKLIGDRKYNGRKRMGKRGKNGRYMKDKRCAKTGERGKDTKDKNKEKGRVKETISEREKNKNVEPVPKRSETKAKDKVLTEKTKDAKSPSTKAERRRTMKDKKGKDKRNKDGVAKKRKTDSDTKDKSKRTKVAKDKKRINTKVIEDEESEEHKVKNVVDRNI